MKRILSALSAFALSLVFTLTLVSMPVRAAENTPGGDFPDSGAAGYLVVLQDPPVSVFSADPLAAATLMAAEDEREELLMLAGDWNIYKTASLSEIQSLVYAGRVAVVEPDYEAELFDVTPVEPNDPKLPHQTNLIGDNSVVAPAAWEAGLTGEGVTVAVIDSGLNNSHEDIPAKVGRGRYFYYRPDPDGQYKLDGKPGLYSYWSSGIWNDSLGHGSMVSGIIAAPADNSTGIASIAPGATILPIRCFTAEEGHVGGYTSNLISGINYAVANGADIINMSWGIKQDSATLKTAIDAAYQAGCILIAAAGNDGKAAVPQYPAAWDNVISVGATNQDGQLTYYSQRVTSVDVCAPGGSTSHPIVSLGFESPTSYLTKVGTSFSAPAVSATAALLLEADPTMTQGDFLALLKKTSHPVTEDENGNPSPERYAGAGRMDIQALLDEAGYAGCSAQRTGTSLEVYTAYHPVGGESGASRVVTLAAGYNAQGHLVESHSADLTRSAYNNCAAPFTFSHPDIAELRIFYLDPSSLSALSTPVTPLIRPAIE